MVVTPISQKKLVGTALNRQLERLMFDEPTDLEIRQMWADRHRLERLVALRDELFPDDDMPLDRTDYELWRAKLRAEMMSLTGVLDGLMICRENSLILPDWLSELTIQFIAVLGQPESDTTNKEIQTRFKAEKKKLREEKRARIVESFLIRSRPIKTLAEGMPLGWDRRPPEVDRAIKEERIRADAVAGSIRDACELAKECLEGTWAAAKSDTIRHNYNSSKANLRLDLEVDDLSPRQASFIGWDTEFVRPDTLKLLGMHTAN